MKSIIQSIIRKSLALTVITAVASCTHPVALGDDHSSITDIGIIIDDTVLIAKTINNQRWNSELSVLPHSVSHIRVAGFDIYGNQVPFSEGHEHEHDDDHNHSHDDDHHDEIDIRAEIRGGEGASWSYDHGEGVLLAGEAASLQIRFIIWHGNHADMITPWLTVRVAND